MKRLHGPAPAQKTTFPQCVYCKRANHDARECMFRPGFCRYCQKDNHSYADCRTAKRCFASWRSPPPPPLSKRSLPRAARRRSPLNSFSSPPPLTSGKYLPPHSLPDQEEIFKMQTQQHHPLPPPTVTSYPPAQQHIVPLTSSTPPLIVSSHPASPVSLECRSLISRIPLGFPELKAQVASLLKEVSNRAAPENVRPLLALLNDNMEVVSNVEEGVFYSLPSGGTLRYSRSWTFPTNHDVLVFLGLLSVHDALVESKKKSSVVLGHSMNVIRCGNRIYLAPFSHTLHLPCFDQALHCRVETNGTFSVELMGKEEVLGSGPTPRIALLSALGNPIFHLREGKKEDLSRTTVSRYEFSKDDVIVLAKKYGAHPKVPFEKVITKFLSPGSTPTSLVPKVGDLYSIIRVQEEGRDAEWKKEFPKLTSTLQVLGIGFQSDFKPFSPFQFLIDLLEREVFLERLIGIPTYSDLLFGVGISTVCDWEANFAELVMFVGSSLDRVAAFQILGIVQEEVEMQNAIAFAMEEDERKIVEWFKQGLVSDNKELWRWQTCVQ